MIAYLVRRVVTSVIVLIGVVFYLLGYRTRQQAAAEAISRLLSRDLDHGAARFAPRAAE